MTKNTLIFNVGSSTIKLSIFENNKKTIEIKYQNLTSPQAYKKAFNKIYNKLKNQKINLILHRVVHGGNLKKPTIINKKTKSIIKQFSKFAQLHNPKQLMIINLCEKFKTKQYAIFDTSFFTSLPEISKIYPIPTNISKKYKIQRYGFHGLSHKSVSQGLKGKTITIHLGQGASMTAIKQGKPIDTSMGLTPLEGLVMMTRSGSIDPGIITFLEKQGYNTEEILNNKSGIKALTGFSDFKNILKNLKSKKVKLAYDIFIYSIIKYIGFYVAALNGLNNLVFTGAIGTGSAKVRSDICKHLDFLGIKLDKNKNSKNNEIISSKNSKVKVLVREPNEDLEMIKELTQ